VEILNHIEREKALLRKNYARCSESVTMKLSEEDFALSFVWGSDLHKHYRKADLIIYRLQLKSFK